MIYIFTQRNDVERIFAYKTHFRASAILIKEVKNSATNDEWKIVESFLLPLHLLHLISAQVTVDTAKKMLRSNDDDDDEQEEEGESDTDDQSVFDLTAPSPPQLPRQYSVDLMLLETYDWKEMECTHPGCLSLELRREFNRLENTLVRITDNQLETQEYEESLRSYWCISDNKDSNAETSASAAVDDEKCHRRQPKKKNLKKIKLMIGSSSSSSEDE